MPKYSRFWEIFFVILLLGLALLMRLSELDRFVTPDEPYWLVRSANFYYALGQRDFDATFQAEHPGVTTMWAGTLGFLGEFPEYRGTGVGQIDIDDHEEIFQKFEHQAIDILSSARLFMVLGAILLLGVSYLYARSLIGVPASLLGFALIILDPMHSALSRLLHTDALQGTAMLLSVLAFTFYLLKQRKFRDLLISAVAGGLALLTKSPALFLVPYIALLLLLNFWHQYRTNAHTTFRSKLWQNLWPLLFWVLGVVVVFFLLWPAMWVEPLEALRKVYGMALFSSTRGHFSPMFFNNTLFPDGYIGWNYWYYYPLTYLWRTTPIVLMGLGLAVVGYWLKLGPFENRQTRRTIFFLVLFSLFYILMITLSTKKGDRYLLSAQLPLSLISGSGWAALVALVTNQVRERVQPWIQPGFLLIIITVSAGYVLPTFPYYFSYYNPVMGGSNAAPKVMSIGWGEGLDEAARYLMTKENDTPPSVSVWYDVGSFSYFYDGETNYIPLVPFLDQQRLARLLNADYAVIYIHQWQRNFPQPLLDILAQQEPEHVIVIDGLEYARIYDLMNGDLIPPEAP